MLLAIKESHARNCERVQNLNSIVRSFCSSATGLVNDGMEATRGYGKVISGISLPYLESMMVLIFDCINTLFPITVHCVHCVNRSVNTFEI